MQQRVNTRDVAHPPLVGKHDFVAATCCQTVWLPAAGVVAGTLFRVGRRSVTHCGRRVFVPFSCFRPLFGYSCHGVRSSLVVEDSGELKLT